jgi:riboflavin transporter FmnP
MHGLVPVPVPVLILHQTKTTTPSLIPTIHPTAPMVASMQRLKSTYYLPLYRSLVLILGFSILKYEQGDGALRLTITPK